MLQPSLHNIISPVEEGKKYIIVNVLSGNADFISGEEKALLEGKLATYPEEFLQKGYVADPIREKSEYQLKYISFLEEREQEEMQLFFVPTYSCNFTCSYCYQSGYDAQGKLLSKEITDAFFEFIARQFPQRKKYITLFGGEPLLDSAPYRERIAYFIEKAKENQLEIAIVTNGYFIESYLNLLDAGFTREIQVTLDGTGDMHNQRRRLKDNSPTFDKIVANIDATLARNIPVNLRMVVDRDNINDLPALADFAIRKGWTQNPLFKTQIGRNYELHYCQDGQSKLFDRLSLYKELLMLMENHPQIVEFHKPAFSVIRFLEENGKLPDPLFDACPACKSEWAMDYTGTIYSCTATVGKPGEKLGTFFPEIQLNEAKIKVWQQRDVMHIEKCKTCNLQLICGGGCGSIAFNQNNSILSPDCRPLDALHSLGAKAYLE